MIKFKPCPFCGKEVYEYEIDQDGDFINYAIVCNALKGGCGAMSGYATTKIEARKKWNKREKNKNGKFMDKNALDKG